MAQQPWMVGFIPLLLGAIGTTAVDAAQRRIGLVSFDRIEVQGNFIVNVRNDYRLSAIASGNRDTLNRVDMQMRGDTLVIRLRASTDFDDNNVDPEPIRIDMTAQNLQAITVAGRSTVTVAGMRGDDVRVALFGAGRIRASQVIAPTIRVTLNGSGAIDVAGSARAGYFTQEGSGAINADALALRTASITSSGVASGRFRASDSADIAMWGSGSVDIAGRARCVINHRGTGSIICERPIKR